MSELFVIKNTADSAVFLFAMLIIITSITISIINYLLGKKYQNAIIAGKESKEANYTEETQG